MTQVNKLKDFNFRKLQFTILLFTVFYLSGAFMWPDSITKITTVEHSIPPDFGKNETTLICILVGRKSTDKYMKKHFETEYHGKIEFILKDDLNQDKYSDTQEYRYVFDFDRSYYGGGPQQKSYRDYYVLDRTDDVKYKTKGKSANFGNLIKNYAVALEEARIKI